MNATIWDPRDCWFLSGPTASGKTAVALELAEMLGAEILSLDSMAVFRGMDIGTAKPTAEERARVAHHLIDLVEPDQDYSVADYVAAAREAVRHIASRGRVPLFVGGTPLYLKALLRGIFEGPPADWQFRHALQRVAAEKGEQALHDRLAAVDPESAARLPASDQRRVIRALEVFEKTGQSITQLQRQFDRARAADQCHVFVLEWPREELVHRIDRRVDAMFQMGLVAEVEALSARYVALSRTASQAVGYREVLAHLRGEQKLQNAIDQVKLHTRQFAKRQTTWFRSLSECRSVPLSEPFDARQIARQILS